MTRRYDFTYIRARARPVWLKLLWPSHKHPTLSRSRWPRKFTGVPPCSRAFIESWTSSWAAGAASSPSCRSRTGSSPQSVRPRGRQPRSRARLARPPRAFPSGRRSGQSLFKVISFAALPFSMQYYLQVLTFHYHYLNLFSISHQTQVIYLTLDISALVNAGFYRSIDRLPYYHSFGSSRLYL